MSCAVVGKKIRRGREVRVREHFIDFRDHEI